MSGCQFDGAIVDEFAQLFQIETGSGGARQNGIRAEPGGGGNTGGAGGGGEGRKGSFAVSQLKPSLVVVS